MAKRPSPTDIFRQPKALTPEVAKLYAALKSDLSADPEKAVSYWHVALEEADEWPYPNPDEALGPTPTLDDAVPPDTPAPILKLVVDDDDDTPFSEDEPWGRRSDESDRHYLYFTTYRNLGLTRDYKTVANRYNVSKGYLMDLQKQFNWADRVLAWDLLREQVYTKEMLQGVRDMAAEHVRIAKEGLGAMAAAFAAITRRQRKDPAAFDAELDNIPIKSLITIAQRSAQVVPSLMAAERLARNMPTELVAVQVDQKVTVSVDDLTKIVSGLASALPPRSDNGSEYVDAEVVDDEPGATGGDEEGADPAD